MKSEAPGMVLEAVETEISADSPALLEKYVGDFVRGIGRAVRFVWFLPEKAGKSVARVGYYVLKKEVD